MFKVYLLANEANKTLIYDKFFRIAQGSFLNNIIEILPSAAKEMGFLEIRELCLSIKQSDVNLDSLISEGLFVIKVQTWVGVLDNLGSPSDTLKEALNYLLINTIKLSSSLKYFNFHNLLLKHLIKLN